MVNHPLVRSIGPVVGLTGTLAGVWRWVLQKPWPWTRRTLGHGDPDDDAGDERSGYL